MKRAHENKQVFIHTRIKEEKAVNLQAQFNYTNNTQRKNVKQFISNNEMQKETTANYRHTESLLYYYLKDEASTPDTHSHKNPNERK